MLKLTRLLILIAVATFVARPVMACCLTGHDALAMAEPCHEMPMTESTTLSVMDHERQAPVDCPGCLDCESAVIQVQLVDDGALLTKHETQISLAVAGHTSIPVVARPDQFKTGPPDDPPLVLQTPVTLKQRLLI